MKLAGNLRRYALPLVAIPVFVIAAAAVGMYVLAHQRVVFPWQQRYTLNIELPSAQALTPGQGQTVDVAGVAVGAIQSVKLRDGIAVVRAQMDPKKLKRVYANATAVARPKTGLQDMVIALDPGHKPAPALKNGGTVPVAQTRPQISLDEVLSMVDGDTRDYLKLLVAGGAEGLHDRGAMLRRLFQATAPTLRMTRRASAAIADRHDKVARLIHNLRTLSEATAGKDKQLADLVTASNIALKAINRQDTALQSGVSKLPGTIDTARSALAEAKPFSDRLGPTLRALTPAVDKLPAALKASKPLLKEGTPQLRDVLGLVKTARPVLRDLNPATKDLLTGTPDLTRSFRVLRYVTNELAYNPPGSEEGYLFWFAWFAHNSASLLSGSDAHGIFWRGQTMVSCSSASALGGAAKDNPGLQAVLAALPCPGKGKGG